MANHGPREDQIKVIIGHISSKEVELLELGLASLSAFRDSNFNYSQLPDELFEILKERALESDYVNTEDDDGIVFGANFSGIAIDAFLSYGTKAFDALLAELGSTKKLRAQWALSILDMWATSYVPRLGDSECESVTLKLQSLGSQSDDSLFYRSMLDSWHEALKQRNRKD